MEINPSQTSAETESAILAFGHAPSHLARWIFAGVLGVIISLFIFFSWWTLGAHFSIPESTSLLLTVGKKTENPFQSLTNQTDLPLAWKEALSKHSLLPVVLGAWKDETGWHAFSLLPRSKAGTTILDPRLHKIETSGPWALVSDTDLPASKKNLTGSMILGNLFSHPLSSWVADFDLHPFAEETIHTWYSNNILHTSLAVQTKTNQQLVDLGGDIGLLLLSNDWGTRLLALIPFGTATLHDMPVAPDELHLLLDQNNLFEPLSLSFQKPLSPNELKRFLAYLGAVNKQVIQLPDGTLGTGQSLLAQVPTGPISFPGDSRWKSILSLEIDPSYQQIRFGQVSERAASTVCGSKTSLLGYLSPQTVSLLAQSFGFKLETTRRWYFSAQNNQLILCQR